MLKYIINTSLRAPPTCGLQFNNATCVAFFLARIQRYFVINGRRVSPVRIQTRSLFKIDENEMMPELGIQTSNSIDHSKFYYAKI